jgi:hypothetical protein
VAGADLVGIGGFEARQGSLRGGRKKVTIPGFSNALKEDDRIAIAQTILEHLRLCQWEFSKPDDAVQ